MSSDVKRKLAAIMFTDIAEYTALSAKDENRALELLDKQKQILTPIIEEFSGILHKQVGDGLLFTFQTVTDALKCGIKIQEETKATKDLNLRIGIHQGEITLREGDALGDDVNVASRIEPYAAVGGIAISGKVQQDISSLPEFETKFISKPALKGVKQDVKIYCITSHNLPETDITKVTAKLEKDVKKLWLNQKFIIGAISLLAVAVFGIYSAISKEKEVPSIAILMMDNLGLKDDEFWSSSMTADLITKVEGAGLIRVASLKDIRNIDSNLSIEEIAKKLQVKYILTHSFLIKDDGFELWCKLENTENGIALFSNKISEPISMTTQMVGKLANDIITSLKVETKQDVMKGPTINAEAYEFYLKAKYKYKKRENIDDLEIARDLLKKAIELDENLAIAKNLLGITYDVMDDNDKAMEIYLENLKKAEDIGDMVSIGRSLVNIGNIESKQGNSEVSLDNYTRALKIFEEIGDKRRMGIALLNIGGKYHRRHDYELALDYYTHALEIFEKLDIKSLIAFSLKDIGGFYSYNKDPNYGKALDYFNRSLNIYENIGEKVGIAENVAHMGYIYLKKGDIEKSLGYYNRSLNLHKELGDKQEMVNDLKHIGNTYYRIGKYDKALEYYSRLLNLSKELGDKRRTEIAFYNIAQVYWEQGDYDKAVEYYIYSLKIVEEVGAKHRSRAVLNNIGWSYYEMGDYDEALDYYNRLIKVEEELDDMAWLPFSFNNIGIAYFQQEDYKKALEYLDKSATIQIERDSTITLETMSYLFLSKKILGKEYNIAEIHTLIKQQDEIEHYINYTLFMLLEDTSYLEIAYNQVQGMADNLEPEVKVKFLNYPIPKVIIEEWEKLNN